MGTKNLGAVVSTFATNTDGWSIEGDVASDNWQATGGNPGGNYQWVDAATGQDSYWDASSAYHGNDSAFYGGNLSYDIEDTGNDYSGVPDVELTGGGMTLVATVGQPGTGWTHESIALGESANWKIGSLSGATATAAQVKAVLASVTDLQIRAEFVNGAESGGLDNVIMSTASTAGTKIWLDAGDDWSTAGDWTGGTAPVSTDKVLITEGDPQITANVSLKGRFGEGSGGTVTLAGGYLSLQGNASLAGVVNGSSKFYTHGATTVSGLTIGGTVQLANYGTITQSGVGLMLGDTTGAKASLNNTASGSYLITDDTGILLGASASSSITNAGQLEKSGGTGTSVIAPNLVNTGTVTAASGTLDLAGTVTGTGGLTINDGATLQFDASVASSQTASFADGNGRLDLTSAGNFHAMVAGFSGADTIDLANVAPQGASATYKPNAANTGGQLKIVSGTTKDYINLQGQYSSSNFIVNPDSGHGTVINYVIPA